LYVLGVDDGTISEDQLKTIFKHNFRFNTQMDFDGLITHLIHDLEMIMEVSSKRYKLIVFKR